MRGEFTAMGERALVGVGGHLGGSLSSGWGSLGQDPAVPTHKSLSGRGGSNWLCQIQFIPELWLLEPGRLRMAGRGLSLSSWGHLGGLVVAGQPCPRTEGLDEPPQV